MPDETAVELANELLPQKSDAPQPESAADPPKSAVLLVDLSSIAHPIWHMSQQEPDPNHTSQRTAAVVRSLAADSPHTAICCDSPSSFRKELDETYKANRPAQEAPLHHQIDLAREALAADGFPVWCVDGFEGDDLIATATAEILSRLGCQQHVLIASADKDLLALVSDRVEVHSTRTGSQLGPDEVKAKLGVGPGLVVDYLTLVGDASDNIKGAKGIGPKTAAALLTYFGSLNALYSAIDAGSASSIKPAQLASLEELRPRLEAVRELVRMRTDVPLDIDAVFQPRVPKVAKDFMEGDEMEMEETNYSPATAAAAAAAEKNLKSGPTDVETDGEFKRRVQMEMKANPDPPPAEPQPAAPVAVVEQPAPVEWERSLEPRSMLDARNLSKWLHDSRMFSAYGTPQAVLSTVLLGRELGLPSMAALRSVHIIEGKHSLSADLMVALVLKSGMAEYFQLVESTDEICTFETKRTGAPNPMKLSYTIEDAGKAGLLAPPRPGKQPGPWHKIPKLMLRARCKSELARLEYPDLLAGLYTPEELRDAKNGS